ncbi:MAG TPA: type I phosphomannose isomerase catalytic subunit [Chlamydiales bacterium]|nr:type I phosphomannose isomerase catalytic subunit [Chlamydiales bacterium]
MYPIRFKPVYQDYVWGGDRIAAKYHRDVTVSRIAESWEISDRDDGMSVAMNGAYRGKSLHELMREMGENLVGVGQKFDRFPLLLKIIDAKENLSIQVHPDEQTAPGLKGDPKTEMWFILEEGTVLAGLKKEVSEKQFLEAIKTNKAEECLEKLELKRGEAIYIPGGRVHAVCAGTLLYEVQQNSNTTYRLYDWGRTGRALHLKEGLAAIHWSDKGHAKVTPQRLQSDLHHQIVTLVSSPFFIVERFDIFDKLHIGAIPKSFQIFFCIEGEGEISADSYKEPFQPGMTYLIPAAAKAIEIEGKCQALRVRLP